MNRATVYKRRKNLIVHPSSETTAGVVIATPPFTLLPEDVSPTDLGRAVLEALKASQEGVPHPTDWGPVTEALLNAAEVKSWANFAKGTISCALHSDGTSIRFTPKKNNAPRGGFTFLEDRALAIPAQSSAEDIGQGVLDALTISERAQTRGLKPKKKEPTRTEVM